MGGPQPIHVWPGPLSDLYRGWLSLGRDMNGQTLYSERDRWLQNRGNGWVEEGMQEAGHYFFLVLESALGEIHSELYPPPK